MKLIILSAVLLSLFAVGCGSGSQQQTTARQIISNSWEGENELDEKDIWKPLTPPVIITKADSGDVVTLFVCECIAKAGFYTAPGTTEPIELFGVPIEFALR